VFSIFANLSPFVQFVGRIMRVIEQNSPGHIQNQGSVVFHAGANIAGRWKDFQEYSEADQDFFDQLLPMEGLEFRDAAELVVAPKPRRASTVEVKAQTSVLLEEIPLIQDDEEAMRAIETLRAKGFSPEAVRQAMELQAVPTTKADERKAARSGLDIRIRNEVGRILGSRNLNSQGHDLDKKRLNRTNFVIVKAALDNLVNAAVGKKTGERHDFTRPELDTIDARFAELVQSVEKELFNG
jgi:DNA-binding transcriptional MerR regulator